MLLKKLASTRSSNACLAIDKIVALTYTGTKNLSGIYLQQAIAFNSMILSAAAICTVRLLYIVFIADLTFEGTGYILWNTAPIILHACCFFLMRKQKFKPVYFFGFIGFPVLLFILTFFVHDKGIVAFQICFLIYPFYFLNNFKKILVCFLVALLMAIAGYLNQYQSHELHKHSSSANFLQYITYAGAVLFAFINLHAIKIQLWAYQKGITNKRKQLEHSFNLIREKNREIETDLNIRNKILSVISHDLRVPLFGLRNILQSFRHTHNAATISELLPEITHELDKVNLVYENLLYWAKLQLENTQLCFDLVDISDTVNKSINVINSVSNEKKVRIINKITKNTLAYSDGRIAEIIIRNLVSNSVKFTPTGKSVFVSASRQESKLIVEIEDEGVGISEPELKKIFNSEFYSTRGTNKETGTGIGLMVCRELAEKLTGEISIKSIKGQGTTVSLSLPV